MRSALSPPSSIVNSTTSTATRGPVPRPTPSSPCPSRPARTPLARSAGRPEIIVAASKPVPRPPPQPGLRAKLQHAAERALRPQADVLGQRDLEAHLLERA